MTRRSHMDRRALFTSGAAAALLAASGVSAAGVPKPGGRLRMALSGADRSNSWAKGDGLFMQVARQGLVFDTLTEVAADGTLRPELALQWRASEDGQVWTFDLRPDVHFHDGRPFTSMDAAASLTPVLRAEMMPRGPHELQIRLALPDAGLPLRLAQPDHVIRPAHAPNSGIGTGLYQVKRFVPGQRLLAVRVAQHYKDGSAGWFEEVELTSIPSEIVRSQALGEYLVDAADLHDASGLAGLPDVVLLPDARDPVQAVSTDLAQPAQISTLRPLDNLRAAERWWFG